MLLNTHPNQIDTYKKCFQFMSIITKYYKLYHTFIKIFNKITSIVCYYFLQFFFNIFISFNQILSVIKKPCNIIRVGSSNRIKQNQAPQNPTNLPLGDQFNHQHQTAIIQETIPHPCNSSSCPQARRPIKVAHSFNFSIVTPLVNMSVGFLDSQIFSSITTLSSTR